LLVDSTLYTIDMSLGASMRVRRDVIMLAIALSARITNQDAVPLLCARSGAL
jgi:hypothetical protein